MNLPPNDLVEIGSRRGKVFGYYVALNRATGAIDVKEHDLSKEKVKNGIHQSVGVKTVLSFEKYQVDPLGKEIRLCKTEKRLELKNKKA